MSLLVRASRQSRVAVNLEIEERNYSKQEQYFCPQVPTPICPCNACMQLPPTRHTHDGHSIRRHNPPQDGYVCFRNSELLSGNLCKKTLGGQKGGLYYVLLRDHGSDAAARCMNRLAKLCGRLIGGHRGFSIGIDDVMPSEVLLDLKVRWLFWWGRQTKTDKKAGGMAGPGAITRQNQTIRTQTNTARAAGRRLPQVR